MTEVNTPLEEKIRLIHSMHHDESSKYVYFLLTVSVSAIGFAFYNFSTAQEIIANDILMFVAYAAGVLLWACSIFAGIQNRKNLLSSMHGNRDALEIERGSANNGMSEFSTQGLDVEKYNEAYSRFQKYADTSVTWWSIQAISFVMGCVLFGGVHLVYLYPNNNNSQIINKIDTVEKEANTIRI